MLPEDNVVLVRPFVGLIGKSLLFDNAGLIRVQNVHRIAGIGGWIWRVLVLHAEDKNKFELAERLGLPTLDYVIAANLTVPQLKEVLSSCDITCCGEELTQLGLFAYTREAGTPDRFLDTLEYLYQSGEVFTTKRFVELTYDS